MACCDLACAIAYTSGYSKVGLRNAVGTQVAAESKMTVDVEEYMSSFRTDLCDVLAAWSRGAKFAEVMKMTDVFEVSPARHIPPSALVPCSEHNSTVE